MKIYLEMDGENILSWGTSPVSDNYMEMEIEYTHPILESVRGYKLIDGELVKDEKSIEIELLSKAKENKEKELNEACNQSILDGFSYAINGEKYRFSFDTEAQFNFQGAERLLSQGVIDEITWTVKQNDEYKRVSINKDDMNQIMLVIFQHKANNISKYRDVLLPMVERATTIEEVNSVTWDSVKMSFEN